jgi:hypothetical protein
MKEFSDFVFVAALKTSFATKDIFDLLYSKIAFVEEIIENVIKHS